MKLFVPALLLSLSLLFTTQANAQKDKPTAQEVSKAKTLKEKYKDEDVVISDKKTEITFTRNNKTNKVEVREEIITTFFAIASRADIGYNTGYDNESSIETLSLTDKRNKRIAWNINDEAYSTESVFHNDYRVKYAKLTFPLQGYLRTVKEVKEYKDVKYFTTDYFVEPYRVMKGTMTITIPDWLEMDIKEYHFGSNDIKKVSKKVGADTQITFKINNLSPMKREYRMPGNSYIYPHVLYLTKSFKDNKGTEVTLFKVTQDLYNWYSSLVNDVDIQTTDIAVKVKELTDGLTTDDEKVKAIYYWVQDNIKYIAFEDGIAGFKPDSPQNVFNKKYGDCKGMAILLKTMLVEAGYDARLVWIGTDHISYDYSTPSLSVDNHMITAIMVDGNPIFIDGTEKFNSYGTFATRIQGKQALIENGETFLLKKVPQATPEFNKEVYHGTFKIDGNDLVGTINKELTGEQASSFLYGFTGMEQDKRQEVMLKVLTDGNNNATVQNVSDFDPTDRDAILKLNYNLKVSNAVSSFDDNLYLELDPVRYLADWTMEEDRENSYKMSNTRVEQKNISLELPVGYQIETLPDAISIDNQFLQVEARYTLNGNSIDYNSQIKIKNRLIKKTEFKIWNAAIQQIKNFYDEQIVLKKV
ncbi:transglutaminase domain-containing protein [Nonlabens mediterrranea]|uniref:Transglutaminase domain-containing protein n=1 Tax=Nonlabens mediterrranea TaxID=1419947 RepID=A0ABS0A7C2_9FLAO|nr:transglutaminase domain-containing protein [Nonlabens mediterrranea]